MSTFVNTLPYISNPVEEFKDYTFVSREENIYPELCNGYFPEEEINFFTNIIQTKKLKKILDLGIGSGQHLMNIFKQLKKNDYVLEMIEGNEVNTGFIQKSEKLFSQENIDIKIHKGNRLDLPNSIPPYQGEDFDFAFLAGNSLTYVGGGSRLYTKLAQKSIINKFASLIKPGGYLFIDTRDYDYIKSLMMLHPEEIMKAYTFEKKVHHHGTDKKLTVFPAYISDAVVVLHYYNHENKTRGKQEYFPIYHNDIVETLSEKFEIEQIYSDYDVTPTQKCMLRQYLAKKK